LRSKGHFVDKSIPYSLKYFENYVDLQLGKFRSSFQLKKIDCFLRRSRPQETGCKSIKFGLSVRVKKSFNNHVEQTVPIYRSLTV